MRVAVSDLCREATGSAAAHLVTRETGAAVRAAVAERLLGLERGEVLILDFAGVGIIDFSCADECLAKLVLRLNAGEYGERYLCLTGLGESQRENIQVALERKKLPALLLGTGSSWELLGNLTPHLRETLRLVVERDGMSARELADLRGIELTAASTRLINLHRLRLVRRRERAMEEGGREFVYESLPQSQGVPARGASRG
ncbi:MAG TPA: hypothetical protein VN317_05955 [Candidatus Methanoperedens sp.]|nr:hypothetical protein [Candidatus Methanoperedens sp.]